MEQWLTIVKGACENNAAAAGALQSVSPGAVESVPEVSSTTPNVVENAIDEQTDDTTMPKGVYKITIRDGKNVLAEVIGSERAEADVEDKVNEEDQTDEGDDDDDEGDDDDDDSVKEDKSSVEPRPVVKVVNEDPIAQESLPPRKLAEGKRHQFSLMRRNERGHSSEPEKKSLREKKRASPPRKGKTDLKSKLKDRKSHERSTKEKTTEEKAQEEKAKQSLMKLITPSIGNLGKIPRKSKDVKKSSVDDSKKPPGKDPKKYNISIETRKGGEDRPKTVKVFNSRLRSTGLEELPPPPKSSKKKEEPVEKKPIKRPSPIKEVHVPEKKAKQLEKEEKLPEKPLVTSPSAKPKGKRLRLVLVAWMYLLLFYYQ